MSHKSDVVLDRGHIMAMLQDPGFFEFVPDFAHLKQSVEWAIYAAKNGLQAGTCIKCKDLSHHFRPIVAAFMLKITEMLRMKAEGLQSVRAYLARKKRYDVGQVIIYYKGKSADSMQKLSF